MLACLVAMPIVAQNKAKVVRAAIFTNEVNYDAQIIGVGTEGTKYFSVSGYGKKTEGAIFQAQMNAVHACLFKDIAGTPTADASPAIYGSIAPKPEHEDFFDAFFAPNGQYLGFIANRTNVRPKNAINMGKGYYKVTLDVQVNYDQLRDYMIEQGIIKAFAQDVQGTKPSMMIFPAKEWCVANGCVDANGNPDYDKALQNQNLRDMITLFESFMSQNGYPINNLRQSLNNYADKQARNMAEEMVGNDKAKSPMDLLLEAFKPDLIIQFEPRKKSYAGQQYYEFAINVYDVFGKQLFGNVAQGTPVSGSAQEVNQLKEAIQNVRDKFFTELNQTFARQLEQGREIEITVDRRDMCELRFDDMVGRFRISDMIQQWVRKFGMPNSSFSANVTPNVVTLKQVYIPHKYEMEDMFGDKVEVQQYALDFGQRLADFLAQQTQENFTVISTGLGSVTVTMGPDATRDY